MRRNGRVVAGAAGKSARKEARSAVGPLSHHLVSPKAARSYEKSCQAFFLWTHQCGFSLPDEVVEFDQLLMDYIDEAWEEGESRSVVANLLSGLHHYVPGLRGKLNGAWRLHAAWCRKELPERSHPMPPKMITAFAGLALHWKLPGLAVGMLLGYHCFLRTGELCAVQFGHILVSTDLSWGSLRLPTSKSQQRTGVEEQVDITDGQLLRLLNHLAASAHPGDPLIGMTTVQFRKYFSMIRQGLELNDLRLLPYSIRRGGATSYFRDTGSLDKTVVRGRWANSRTARIYINAALQDMATYSPCLLYTS